MVVRPDRHSRRRNWMRAVKTRRKKLWSIGSMYLCMCVCMNRRGSQPEKNSINVGLSLLHSGNLGHLKEYSWISNPATTAELNLLNSPAGDNWAGRKQEEWRNWKRERRKKWRWNKGRGEETKKGDTAIDAGKTGEGEAEVEIWRETGGEKSGGDLSEETALAEGEMKCKRVGGEGQEWREGREVKRWLKCYLSSIDCSTCQIN